MHESGRGDTETQAGMPVEATLALQRGHKIEAIKIVREQTGLGLAEAKDLVERAGHGYEPERPRQVRAGKEDAGVLRLLFIILILAGVAAAVFML